MSCAIRILPEGTICKIYDSPVQVYSDSYHDGYSLKRRGKHFKDVPLKKYFGNIEYDLDGQSLGLIRYKKNNEVIMISGDKIFYTTERSIYVLIDNFIYMHGKTPVTFHANGIQDLFVHKCDLDTYRGFIAIDNNIHLFKAHKEKMHVYPEIYLRNYTIRHKEFVRIIHADILRDSFIDIFFRFTSY